MKAIHARGPAEPTESWQAPSSSVSAVSAATGARVAQKRGADRSPGIDRTWQGRLMISILVVVAKMVDA
jgi:Na+-driven multidrug efflux pump